jgi:hypothetical protein
MLIKTTENIQEETPQHKPYFCFEQFYWIYLPINYVKSDTVCRSFKHSETPVVTLVEYKFLELLVFHIRHNLILR